MVATFFSMSTNGWSRQSDRYFSFPLQRFSSAVNTTGCCSERRSRWTPAELCYFSQGISDTAESYMQRHNVFLSLSSVCAAPSTSSVSWDAQYTLRHVGVYLCRSLLRHALLYFSWVVSTCIYLFLILICVFSYLSLTTSKNCWFHLTCISRTVTNICGDGLDYIQ